MNWLQIYIKTTKSNSEAAEDCLFAIGAQTVTFTDAGDQPILVPVLNEAPLWNEVIITGLFSYADNEKALLDSIKQTFADLEYSFHAEILEDQNWSRAWMEHYHAMQFGERLWVCPLHQEPPNAEAINLRLDPGLAFGTGTHPTTALCLRWLDQNIEALRNIKAQKNLLDFGCGSGILAIAACLLGVEHADGVDIDPQALIATSNNAETNLIKNQIDTYSVEDFGKSAHDTQYDIVIANILSGPLAELAPTLYKYTKTRGHVVLSGILQEQAESLLNTYREFFIMDDATIEDGWVLLHGIKK